MTKNGPEKYYGKTKPKRGRVEMVLFNEKNPEHIQAINILDAEEPHLKEGENLILQFYNKKPVGFLSFSKVGNDMYVDTVYVNPQYRDTIQIRFGENKPKGFSPQINIKTYLRERREQLGLTRRANRLFLAAKMIRWVAKTYGLPLKSYGATPQSEKIINKYANQYTLQYFKKRGKHKPDSGRKV